MSKKQPLRRQHSGGDKPKKQRSSLNKVTNEDSGILLSTEDWEETEPSGGGLAGDSQMVGVTVKWVWLVHTPLVDVD